MKLSKAIRKECLRSRVRCEDKEEVLREVTALAKQCHDLDHISTDRIFDGFRNRESIESTGVGDGVALPHCRIPEVAEFVVGLMTLAVPVDFDAIDGEAVAIVAFIVGPESESPDHARILSGLSMCLCTETGRKKILAAEDAAAMYDALQIPEVKELADDRYAEKRVMQIMVRDSDVFYRVLEVVASVDGTDTVVFESSGVGEHLSRVPMFARFLVDSGGRFSRVILTTVPKVFTNETLRRIEAVTGNLNDRGDITVIVHDAFFVAGSLDV